MASGYKQSIIESVALNVDSLKKGFIPDILRLEVTNACNSGCIFCGHRKMTRSVGFIKEGIARKALTQGYAMGIRKFSLHTTGEPFLHPKIVKIVSLGKYLGYDYMFLNTNGAAVSRGTLEEIVRAGLNSLAFSINAINRLDYKLIHGKDDFDAVLENLKWLFEFRKKYKLNFNVYVSCIKTKLTDYCEDDIRSFFSDWCDEVRIQNVQNIGGFCPDMDVLGVSESDLYFHYEIPCRIPFKSLIVTCEGYLTACSVDFQNYLTYANLNICSLEEAWRDTVLEGLRSRHLNRDVAGLICDNCANCSKAQPQPLDNTYSTMFDIKKILSDQKINERISQWKKER